MLSTAGARTTRAHSLTELWVHTGTACNLNCAFCLEGSGPGDSRLERVKLDELRPYFDTAVELGVQHFAFTGGEPLIVKDIVRILDYALGLRPCLVLTNGTAPLIKRVHQLDQLLRRPHPLSFRISIDYPDEQRHDAGRGLGNFRKALAGMKLLHERGFPVSLARQMEAAENTTAVDARFRALFRKQGLPEDTAITRLPDFGALGNVATLAVESASPGPSPPQAVSKPAQLGGAQQATERPATGQQDGGTLGESQRDFMPDFMCNYSRMVVKQAGRLRVYACPLVDDDLRYDLGANLVDSLRSERPLTHRRCATCFECATRYGV